MADICPMDLEKRFSLDYLVSGSKAEPVAGDFTAPTKVGADAMSRAIRVFTAPILRELDKTPAKPKPLFELFDNVKRILPEIDIDGFRDVINWMGEANLIKIVERDPHGNDLLQKA